jgi:hypothetical protein
VPRDQAQAEQAFNRVRGLAAKLRQWGRRSDRPELERKAASIFAQLEQACLAVEREWLGDFQFSSSSGESPDVVARTARARARAWARARDAFSKPGNQGGAP